jgi:hypothetical protein
VNWTGSFTIWAPCGSIPERRRQTFVRTRDLETVGHVALLYARQIEESRMHVLLVETEPPSGRMASISSATRAPREALALRTTLATKRS